MQINGSEATVEVFGAKTPMAEVLRQLGGHYENRGASHFFYPGETMGWGMALIKGRVERFLVTARDPGHSSVVYRISQSEAEFRKGQPDYTRHRLTDLPVFSGSRPTYFNADAGTRTRLEVSRCGAPAPSVYSSLDASLRNAGWAAVLPPAGEMKIYQKGRDIAVIQVSSSPDGDALITRVLKRGAASQETP